MSQALLYLIDDLTHRLMTNCVFVFKGKDGNNTTLAAHRDILGAVSPVFRDMFFSPVAQSSAAKDIQITDISHKCFEKLLWSIYGKKFTIENGDEAFELYEAAEKYNVSSGREIARDYMIKTNGISTASLYFKAGVLFNDVQLEIASKDIFSSVIYNITKTPGFFEKTDEIVDKEGFKIENNLNADLCVALQPFKDSIQKEDNLNTRICKTLQLIRFLTSEAGQLFSTIISPSLAKLDCSLNYIPPQSSLEELKKHMIIYLNCARYKTGFGFGYPKQSDCSCKSHSIGETPSQLVPKLMGKYLTGNLTKYTLEDVKAVFEEFKKYLLPPPPPPPREKNTGIFFGASSTTPTQQQAALTLSPYKSPFNVAPPVTSQQQIAQSIFATPFSSFAFQPNEPRSG